MILLSGSVCSWHKIACKKWYNTFATVNNDFLSLVKRFGNDFSLVTSSLVKIIAESPHSWQKIVIHGNSCILFFITKIVWLCIRGVALKWFQSYWSGRYQYVTYNGAESTKQNIKYDVPQGSILGPLLYLIYINDLANVCKYKMQLLFADDTNLFRGGKNINNILDEISHDHDSMSEWLKSNKLSLNIKKRYISMYIQEWGL